MHFFSSLLVAAVAGIAQAQTPQGFSPASNTKLDVIFNTTAVNTPGQLLSKQRMFLAIFLQFRLPCPNIA